MISPDKAFPGMAELPRFQQVCWFDAGPPRSLIGYSGYFLSEMPPLATVLRC